MDISINGLTLNVAGERAPPDIGARLMRQKEPDLFVVSLQEVDLALQLGVLLFWDQWTQQITKELIGMGYYRVESIRMQGIVLTVFARRHLIGRIRHVKTDWIGTGYVNFWGNKGAVAIRLTLDQRQIAIVNTHLPHGVEEAQFQARLSSVDKIFENVTFNNFMTLFEHDVMLWFGDLNFRIRDYTRDEVIDKVKDATILECLASDELNRLLTENRILKQFTESKITFPPTYKFNINTTNYDSSAKRRKPAWTDRILRFNKTEEIITQLDYANDGALLVSDHRPVFGDFKLQTNEKVSTRCHVEVNLGDQQLLAMVEIDASEVNAEQDWLAIYPLDFDDYRGWSHFQYIAFAHTNVEREGKRHISCYLPFNDLTGGFVIGYYAARHQNLIALSTPFQLANRVTGVQH